MADGADLSRPEVVPPRKLMPPTRTPGDSQHSIHTRSALPRWIHTLPIPVVRGGSELGERTQQ